MGTTYGPMGLAGGYEDYAINEDTYHVKFAGNGFTSQAQVEAYWLKRCAHLIYQEGYDYFEIIEAQTNVDTRTWQEDQQCTGQVTNYGYSQNVDMKCTGGGARYVNYFVKEGIIVGHDEDSYPRDKVVYDVNKMMGVYGH